MSSFSFTGMNNLTQQQIQQLGQAGSQQGQAPQQTPTTPPPPTNPPLPQSMNFNPPQVPTNGPGLPPTGLEQQLQSMRASYDYYRNIRIGGGQGNVGANVHEGDRENQTALPSTMQRGSSMPMGQTSLQQLAQRLAQSYGLSVGREPLVDAEGNFNYTPDQLSEAAGGGDTMGEAAAKMNFIAAAIQRQQQAGALKKSEAALQAGLGLTGKRSRGSMIEQQQQFYAGLSDLYQNQQYEAMDFSYYIQREQQLLQLEIYNKLERRLKKNARSNFWTGIAVTALGAVSGNTALMAQGGTMVGTSAEGTGYF